MSELFVAKRDMYNSETGEFFRPGDVIPDTEENAILLKTKERRGKKIIPGIGEKVKATVAKVAGDDKAKAGAGQDGRKPAPKRPAKAASETTAEALAASDADAVDIVIGGTTRVTPTGGKVQDVDAATGSALD